MPLGAIGRRWAPRVLTRVLTQVLTHVLTQVLTRVLTQALLGAAGPSWAPLGAAWHICANFATCSWELLTMLNPHFVAGEHGLFGGHKSKDIHTFLFILALTSQPRFMSA